MNINNYIRIKNASMQNGLFTTLPRELIQKICELLSLRDLCNFSRVNKEAYQAVRTAQEIRAKRFGARGDYDYFLRTFFLTFKSTLSEGAIPKECIVKRGHWFWRRSDVEATYNSLFISQPRQEKLNQLLFIHIRKVETCRFLLELGANVNCKNKSGNTPLLEALESADLKVIRVLLNRGADVNAIGTNDQTSLMWVTAKYPQHIETFLQAGADQTINQRSKTKGNTALLFAKDPAHSSLLIRYGADPNIRTFRGLSPLDYAVIDNRFDQARLLIERGARTDLHDESKIYTLMRAVNYSNILELLLANGAATVVNKQDIHGNTALHHAVSKLNRNSFYILIRYGADRKIRNSEKNTADDILWSPWKRE